MEMIYNSPNYCVVEFPEQAGSDGGYEIMDKAARRELFLEGALARQFRLQVGTLIAGEPDIAEVDQYLGRFEGLMHHPLVLH